MGHPHLKVGVCKAPCFLDDPKSKTVRLQPPSKECGFRFMDIKETNAKLRRTLNMPLLLKNIILPNQCIWSFLIQLLKQIFSTVLKI